MAHSGFCSNEQIIKSIKKRFKNAAFFLVSPEILFLEELNIFLEESAIIDGLTAASIIKSGKQMYKDLPMSDKMRYVKLAQEFNSAAFDE
ncbi:hypothetical protein KR038_005172 [Drosophila bunnanda]|nr:hypothetical protein KR038_005172 [Drosophila bunnanda]